ncbi:hypothetical protein AX774_g3406 [Zancudomyces culisetae]|uniref:Secreted protein n=1 Tax=Zancudomyces culisetae TaxID=1213189 RepID=A0A1R1PQ43_ZANCU|nr:hypothetical protein AX774_g3406 [Zancudomyces culisetae]|eukprot:OMH83069.1 hypothetical protein AX774_g3406 [Zancudomyces culisetae]
MSAVSANTISWLLAVATGALVYRHDPSLVQSPLLWIFRETIEKPAVESGWLKKMRCFTANWNGERQVRTDVSFGFVCYSYFGMRR